MYPVKVGLADYRVNEKITERNFSMLSQKYQQEQGKLEKKIEALTVINLANKAVNNLDFLYPVAVLVLGGLMDKDFFNQGSELIQLSTACWAASAVPVNTVRLSPKP